MSVKLQFIESVLIEGRFGSSIVSVSLYYPALRSKKNFKIIGYYRKFGIYLIVKLI